MRLILGFRSDKYLQIAQLSKLLGATLHSAAVWLIALVHYSMGLNVATLGEASSTLLTAIRTLTRVSALMCLIRSVPTQMEDQRNEICNLEIA